MKIIVASGDRFHAYALAKQLLQRHALQRLYTFNYTANDAQRVPSPLVNHDKLCALLNTLYQKARLSRLINRTSFNSFKDRLFERNLVAALAKENSFDLFVCWSGFLHDTLPIARNKGAKVILETGSCHTDEQEALIKHEYDRYGLTIKSHDKKRQAQARLEYDEADLIMTPSLFVKESFIKRGFAPKKIAVAPYGVDTSFFSPAKQIPPLGKKFTLLFVGMVSLQKGLHYLLHAWQKAALPIDQAKLVLVGALQKDFLLVKNKLPIAGNVIFAGGITREALKKQYQTASAFVLPSVQEGLAMVIGEAMASGLPVIASTHTGAQNLITPGETGLLYHPYAIDSLAGHIRWCYENSEAAALMGKQAHQHIQAFSWDAYGKLVFESYKQLVGHE